jgi:hypothetical protein
LRRTDNERYYKGTAYVSLPLRPIATAIVAGAVHHNTLNAFKRVRAVLAKEG